MALSSGSQAARGGPTKNPTGAARNDLDFFNQLVGKAKKNITDRIGGGQQQSGGGRAGGPVPPPVPTQNGGGGGGGANNSGSALPLDTSTDANVDKQIREGFEGILDGSKSRYSDERVKLMKDEMFESTMGQVKSQIRGADASAARRGLFRSGIAARTETDLRREGLKSFSKGVREIMIKKMDAEFQDRMQALNLANTYLNNKRQYALGVERNAIAREQISAQMAIASMQNETARAGIAAANGRARAALDFQKEAFTEQLARQDVLNSRNFDSSTQAPTGFGF